MLDSLRSFFRVSDSSEKMADVVRANRRSINRSIRMIEREELRIQQEELSLFNSLKSQALSGRMDRLQARELLIARRRRGSLVKCKTQLNNAAFQVQQQQTTHRLHLHIKRCSEILQQISKTSDLPDIQTAAKDFAVEAEKLNFMDELMAEALETGVAEMEDEEDEDLVIKEIWESAHGDLNLRLLQAKSPTTSPVAEVYNTHTHTHSKSQHAHTQPRLPNARHHSVAGHRLASQDVQAHTHSKSQHAHTHKEPMALAQGNLSPWRVADSGSLEHQVEERLLNLKK